MEKNIGKEFGGERPLYRKKDLYLEDVVIRPGESGLKETANITAVKCRFEGKYPLWECDGFVVKDSILTVGARSGLWYSRGGELYNTIIDAPKTFRRMTGIKMRDCWIPGGSETFWDCSDIDVKDCQIERADYVFMHCENIVLENVKLQGNYGFQYAKNVVIKNCILNSKDSFWEAENVEVYDSVINGEYLAWYSKNLKLVRCHITETQPLCYCEGLVMEDCTFGSDCDLAFEYSDVEATVKGHVVSIKNPRSGHIHVGSVGEIIIDENIKAPGDCQITSDK
ncbi:MAG: DUF3737 family protein [Bacteroidales bacterium]|nr:DUF3737 family protein [Bacteroidales bacterium]